jgi:hypothetical protein
LGSGSSSPPPIPLNICIDELTAATGVFSNAAAKVSTHKNIASLESSLRASVIALWTAFQARRDASGIFQSYMFFLGKIGILEQIYSSGTQIKANKQLQRT